MNTKSIYQKYMIPLVHNSGFYLFKNLIGYKAKLYYKTDLIFGDKITFYNG